MSIFNVAHYQNEHFANKIALKSDFRSLNMNDFSGIILRYLLQSPVQKQTCDNYWYNSLHSDSSEILSSWTILTNFWVSVDHTLNVPVFISQLMSSLFKIHVFEMFKGQNNDYLPTLALL